MNAPAQSAAHPGQVAYTRVLNRCLYALIFWVSAWLVVACLQGAGAVYDAPATVATAAYWLSWISYPPAALEVLVSALLLVIFQPRKAPDRTLQFAEPRRIQRARWLLYAACVAPVPLAVVWVG